MQSSNDLEVYHFQGNDGEEIPEGVRKLIVGPGFQALFNEFCEHYWNIREVIIREGLIKIGPKTFRYWSDLRKIVICSTVKFIGNSAFHSCQKLQSVQFESHGSSSHGLKTIYGRAFYSCAELQRIQIPSSVTDIGRGCFYECVALIEANLSTTSIAEISESAFRSCHNLQTVSLPNTLVRICSFAFAHCSDLVTVTIPLDSQPIQIEYAAFSNCKSLANIWLPENSFMAEEYWQGPFYRATLLQERFSERGEAGIFAGLVRRFDDYPVHKMCYDHSAFTVHELRQCIEDQIQVESCIDSFGMTPLHILFSAIGPSKDLLQVLGEALPYHILDLKDANGKRPLDYLLANWTDTAASLLRMTIQIWMIDPMTRWGATLWVEDMTSRVEEILAEGDKERRTTLWETAYRAFEDYQELEVTSILEMALWKMKLKCGRSDDGSKRQAMDRGECQCLCGSDIVIPNVAMFLGIPRDDSSTRD